MLCCCHLLGTLESCAILSCCCCLEISLTGDVNQYALLLTFFVLLVMAIVCQHQAFSTIETCACLLQHQHGNSSRLMFCVFSYVAFMLSLAAVILLNIVMLLLPFILLTKNLFSVHTVN